jgi:ubiquinone/menaquinone biosynthesis C-methylase UbiE
MDANSTYPYPLGHSERELERLAIQARDLAAHTTVLFRRAGLAPGHRVLDIGCGAGDVSLIAADLVGPNGSVVGIDRSPAAVANARDRARRGDHSNVEFMVGDISEAEPPGQFDVIVGRVVLMYVPEPAKALARLRTHLRPHGIVVLQEGDIVSMGAEPECPLISKIRGWMVEAFERTSCVVNMGSRLASVLHQAGFRAEGSWVSQPSYVGINLSRLDWFVDVARTLAPVFEEHGIVSREVLGLETLAARLVAEASARRAIVYAPRLVGIWARAAGGFTP